jgi:hypothetical protein
LRSKTLIRTIAAAATATALMGVGVAGAQVEPPPERTVQPGPVIVVPSPECLLAHVLDPTANRVTV